MDKLTAPKIALSNPALPKVCLMGHAVKDNAKETYITDGLVFHLDGIDKGPTEGKWTDLVGGVEFSPSGDVTWGENSVGGKLTASTPINAPARKSTIEIALANGVKDINGLWFECGLDGTIAVGPYRTYLLIGRGADSRISYANTGVRGKGAHCVSANCIMALHNLATYSPGAVDYWSSAATNAEVYMPYANYGSCIHSIRIYNRLLTEDEMRHNQEVDRKRFNLTFPEPVSTLELLDEDCPEPSGNGVIAE